MNCIDRARMRVEQAVGLAPLLDASYAAFLMLLPVIEGQQDPASPWFAPFVMAMSSAASGRFAVLDAPSLPAVADARGVPIPRHLRAGQTAAALIALSQVLATRLEAAAIAAEQAADRDACARAARHARALFTSLGGASPP